MARKITGEGKEQKDRILSHLDERSQSSVSRQVKGGMLEDELEDDDYGKLHKFQATSLTIYFLARLKSSHYQLGVWKKKSF